MQYCDGLRGAFIIEDPDDPQRYLYDVDDGMITYESQLRQNDVARFYCYYARGLAPLSFDDGTSNPVTLIHVLNNSSLISFLVP